VEIREAVKKRFADGQFKAPQPFPPHLMFYAPGMTNADIGSDGSPGSSVSVVDEKSPHALMIVPVPTGALGPSQHAHAPHKGE
jgi:hypothetical protein